MRITEQPVDGLANCLDPMCPGYRQEAVPAIETIRERTYGDGGVEGIAVALRDIAETSWHTWAFANPDDEECPECGRPRNCGTQVRPVYEPLANRLLAARAAGDIHSGVPKAETPEEIAARLEKAESANRAAAAAGPRKAA